jgi:ubiquinone/menaquinone biosynthesis C-methylase UbiE
MPIDFQDEKNRSTYAKRKADATWVTQIEKLVNVRNKQVVDIGCGGGIYSKVFEDLGASHVIGVDFSEQILNSAKENCHDYQNISFIVGNAFETTLASGQYDIILEKALIHHVDDLHSCFKEAYRLLKNGGSLIVQDRTPEDCLLQGSLSHIRGFFFSKFPELAQTEISRRHSSPKVKISLEEVGFRNIEEHQFLETRKVYPNVDILATDLLNRTGRSILHELSDFQLDELVKYIKEQVGNDHRPIVEQDRWTIWKAMK